MSKSKSSRQQLKELGFTEYDLRVFRQSQKWYSEYDKLARSINLEILDNTTHLSQYDYDALLTQAKRTNTKPRELLQNLMQQQDIEASYIHDYGITSEIYETIENAWYMAQRYNQFFNESLTDENIKNYLSDFNREKYDLTNKILMDIKRYQAYIETLNDTREIEFIEQRINELALSLLSLF